MKVSSKDYQQFLVNTPKYFTCDYVAQYLETSGDSVERFLKNSKLKPSFIWESVRDQIVFSPKGCLIIDKTVLEHNNSKHIELAHLQYSGSSHKTVMGIGVINLVYYNPQIDEYWLIDFRIWDKPTSGKTELDYAQELVYLAVKRNIDFETILFDGFYASRKFLNYVALDLGKIFYTNLKSTSICSQTNDPNSTLLAIKDLSWSEEELQKGKTIRLRKSPKRLTIKLFQIVVKPNKIENLATNKLDDDIDVSAIWSEYSNRWSIELVHREVKQTLGLAKCQCRKQRSQRNHILCALLVYTKLKEKCKQKGITIYHLKRFQLDGYMKWITKNPVMRID